MKMSRRAFIAGAAAGVVSSQLSLRALAATQKTGLKDYYKNAFKIGTAISTQTLMANDTAMLDLIAREFNAITPENLLKWEAVRTPDEGWNFSSADKYVDFATRNKMYTVGHTLAWHSQIPDSVFKSLTGTYISPEQLLKKMENHIGTLVGRYKGRISAWDVVNEAVGDDGFMRKSHYFNILGEDFLVKAFQLAHEADPAAHLMYNDYNTENPDKRKAAVDLIKRLQEKKTPIHGVGMQCHLGIDGPSIEEIEKSIIAFSELGLRVHLTELDIDVLPSVWNIPVAEVSTRFEYKPERDPYKSGLPKEIDAKLSARYESLFKMLLKHKEKVERVTFWGVSDDASWLNDFPIHGRTNYPLLFDRSHKPKEAYLKLIGLPK